MEYVHGGDIYTYGDVLDFSVNVNPYGPSEEVLEAAKRSMDEVSLYPDSQCRRLRKRLAEKKSLPEEYFLFGNGAAELFFSVVLAEKPEKALLPIPAFAEYEQALRTVECEIIYHELKRENNFALTESFLEELTEDIDLVFLCSPSNPSGQVIEPKLMEQILTRCEEKKIRLWIEESDENRQEFFRERKLFDAILLHGDLAYKKVRTRFYIPWRRIAAALSGVAAIVLLTIYVTTYFLQQSFRDETMNTVIVPQGQRVSLTLADGTKVWLNAKTKMEYPQSFKAFDERIVKVDGEAYFEVSKNKNRPFIVKTSKGDIEVLGTKFYVSAYATTDIFETSLIEGRVKVHTAYEDMTLYPRDKAVLQNGILTRKHIDDMDIYRWRDGLYCFKNLSFEDVLKQFEIYYDVRFVKENPQMANPKLNGKFRLIDGVDYALRVLQREVGFSFRRDEETSVIYLK